MRYFIHIIASPFQTGLLDIYHFPGTTLANALGHVTDGTSLPGMVYRREVAIKAGSVSVKFAIPFLSDELWSSTSAFPSQAAAGPSGALIFKWRHPINSVNNEANPPVRILVYMAMADDYQVRVPRIRNYEDQVFTTQNSTARAEVNMREEFTKEFPWFHESYKSSKEQGLTLMGESVNLRNLMHIYQDGGNFDALPADLTSTQITNYVRFTPHVQSPRGYQTMTISGQNGDDASIYDEFSNPLLFLARLYAYWRGGFRYKCMAIQRPQKPFDCMIKAQVHMDLLGATAQPMAVAYLAASGSGRPLIEVELPYCGTDFFQPVVNGPLSSPGEFTPWSIKVTLVQPGTFVDGGDTQLPFLQSFFSAADDFSYGYLVAPVPVVTSTSIVPPARMTRRELSELRASMSEKPTPGPARALTQRADISRTKSNVGDTAGELVAMPVATPPALVMTRLGRK
jgi:hypothetical protein